MRKSNIYYYLLTLLKTGMIGLSNVPSINIGGKEYYVEYTVIEIS